MNAAKNSDVMNANVGVHYESDKITRDYLERIKFTGVRNASLETLKVIHFLHPQAIPFENLSPFLRIPVLLDIDSIAKKMIYDQRGGYCFEHNLLLSHVLKSLGFKVKWLAARVLWNVPEGVVTARSHMVLLVEADSESYIVDAGFGGLTLTSPLLLKTGIEQQTPHEVFRLTKEGDYFIQQARVKGEWGSLYRFTLQEQLLPDYEVSNWYLSNHPASHFVTGIIAALSTPDRRYALRGTNFSTHFLNGDTEKQIVESASHLMDILKNIFLIRLPKNANLVEALEQMIAREKLKQI